MTTPTATPLSVSAVPGTSIIHGRFLWYELMTSDPVAARRFYTAVFGWGTETYDQVTGQEPYVMFTANGRPIAGTMSITEELKAKGVRPHWLCYIGADDVDATVAKAKSLGAQVHMEPFDIPTVGRMAVLSDPQGASFALYHPMKMPTRPDDEVKLGEFGWHELTTTDYKKAFDFYHTLFGWEVRSEEDVGGGMLYLVYRRSEVDIGGMMNLMPGMEQIPPNFGVYVRVDDVHAALERVKANGGTLAHGPIEVPGGTWIANCFDPQGGAISLMQARKG